MRVRVLPYSGEKPHEAFASDDYVRPLYPLACPPRSPIFERKGGWGIWKPGNARSGIFSLPSRFSENRSGSGPSPLFSMYREDTPDQAPISGSWTRLNSSALQPPISSGLWPSCALELNAHPLWTCVLRNCAFFSCEGYSADRSSSPIDSCFG